MLLHFGLIASPVNVLFSLLAGYIVFYSFCSLLIKERIYLSETLVGMVFGILVGPAVLNLVDLEAWGLASPFVLHQFSRILIAIQVMIAGVSLPKTYLWKERLSLFMLLFPGMLFMWLVSAVLVYAFLPLTFVEAMLIGACVAPTDPVLANSIVRGRFAEKHVPMNVRNILSAESGSNDGLGYPYVFLSLLLLLQGQKDSVASIGQAIGEWFYVVWLYQILLSCVMGFVAGYLSRHMLRYAHDHDWIDKESFLAFSFSLALFLMGMVGFLGCDDLLAIFIAGNTFAWDDWFRLQNEETHIQEVIDMLFSTTYFIYFGTMLPWTSFLSIGIVKLFLLSLTVLTLRRLPMIIVLYKWIPAIKTYREALFAGWFGPIGVGAIFFAVESLKVLTIEHDYTGEIVQLLFPVIMWMVLSSTIVHGVTVPFLKIGKQLNREVILPIQRSITMSRTSSISNTRLNEHSTASLSLAKFGRMFAAQKKENVQIVHLGATPSTRINVDMIERANDPMVVHIDDRVESMDVVRTTSVLWADTPLRPTDTV